jgi:hypothetical protein
MTQDNRSWATLDPKPAGLVSGSSWWSIPLTASVRLNQHFPKRMLTWHPILVATHKFKKQHNRWPTLNELTVLVPRPSDGHRGRWHRQNIGRLYTRGYIRSIS